MAWHEHIHSYFSIGLPFFPSLPPPFLPHSPTSPPFFSPFHVSCFVVTFSLISTVSHGPRPLYLYPCTTIVVPSLFPAHVPRSCRRCALCPAFPFCTCVSRQESSPILPQSFPPKRLYQYVMSPSKYIIHALFLFSFFLLVCRLGGVVTIWYGVKLYSSRFHLCNIFGHPVT